jgi:hypothetical protein
MGINFTCTKKAVRIPITPNIANYIRTLTIYAIYNEEEAEEVKFGEVCSIGD